MPQVVTIYTYCGIYTQGQKKLKIYVYSITLYIYSYIKYTCTHIYTLLILIFLTCIYCD